MQRLTGLILLMSALYIFIIPLLNVSTHVVVLFKVIPMVLIIIYGLNIRTKGSGVLVMIGVTVCTVADVAIAYSFIAGLVIFLIGHLFYIPAFWHARKREANRVFAVGIIFIYIVLIGFFIIRALVESGDMSMVVPVVLYIGVIGSMGITAMLTRNRLVIFGAALFIISDSFLAWNRFVEPLELSHVLIMATYYSAQYFIVKSRL
ncbi:putative membrane protein [Geomicrobium sp. JCM 19037]|uniref:lysoplasmalogenase n=1 Tax=Geomicrobium sp. JCM 19037 TaxID=1460634 RepID=UPI00045F2750|nr:lysoplasmalogenase [Geomicrobium sp. JCM 19037]GAK02650.1 putative membrane protein [Geomicrobium sp. JCM 19037]